MKKTFEKIVNHFYIPMATDKNEVRLLIEHRLISYTIT